MATGELGAAAAAAWAEALGCDLRLLDEPGGHLVPGGARLRELNGVYMASVRDSVLVYCPGWLQHRAPRLPTSKTARSSDRRGTGSPTPPTSRLLSAAPGAGWTAMISCWPGCSRRAAKPNGPRAGSRTRTA
jgi:hypothetical protein